MVLHCAMVADTMCPSAITTSACISPWRDEPQPRYDPSFQGGAPGLAGATSALGCTLTSVAGVAGSGAGMEMGGITGVTATGMEDDGATTTAGAGAFAAVGFALADAISMALVGGFSGAAGGTLTSTDGAGGGTDAVAHRSIARASKRSAADRVRVYPAV